MGKSAKKSKSKMMPINDDRRQTAELGAYLLRILKANHHDVSVSSSAMWVLNGIALDLQNRAIKRTVAAAALEGVSTLKSKHALAATPSLFTGLLSRHASAAGTRAVVSFTA